MDELSDGQKEEITWPMRSSISKHGYPNRKGIQDLELLPSLPFSITFKSFGGWVKGQMLLKVKKGRTYTQTDLLSI